ncbi:MAG: hypothetical protein VCD31_09465, partial [Alphaproteobacteria bacterium]
MLNASVKYLAADYSLVQIIWVRSVVHLLWMVVLFMSGMGLVLFATRRLKLQLVRCSLLQLIALVTFVVDLVYIPMAAATAIFFTGLLMVVALAVPFLGERVGIRRWLDWLIFIGLGVLGGLGHLFVIQAYAHAQASIVGPFVYGQLFGVPIIGYLMFAEFPGLWTWIGTAVIVVTGIYVARRF